MNVARVPAAVAVLAAALGGCSWPELPKLPEMPSWVSSPFKGAGVEERAAADCEAVERLDVAGIDWPNAKSVDIHIRKARFTPGFIVLTRNYPNVLRLLNSDKTSRTFSAKDFFRASAIVAVSYDGRPVAETCIDAITIGARKWAEIRIVPLRQGEYAFGEEEPSTWFAGPLPSNRQRGQIIVR